MSASLRRLPLLIATLSLLVASAAWAQAKPDSKTAAKEHYARGTSYYDLGKYDDAIKEFEAAYQLKNDPAFLYNLAQSYRLAGNAERALHFYQHVPALRAEGAQARGDRRPDHGAGAAGGDRVEDDDDPAACRHDAPARRHDDPAACR